MRISPPACSAEIRERCLLASKAGRAFLRDEEAQVDRAEEREEIREERDRTRPASLEEAVQAAVNATWQYKVLLSALSSFLLNYRIGCD
jgi:hypothetical protein